jgi:hypothetical protein
MGGSTCAWNFLIVGWSILFILAGSGSTKFALALSRFDWGKTSKYARLVCHSFFPYVSPLSFFIYFFDPGPPLSPIFSIQFSRPHGINMCRSIRNLLGQEYQEEDNGGGHFGYSTSNDLHVSTRHQSSCSPRFCFAIPLFVMCASVS